MRAGDSAILSLRFLGVTTGAPSIAYGLRFLSHPVSALPLFALLAGIGGNSTGSDASGTGGKIPLRLTDAPVDSVAAVNGNPERIALVPSDADADARRVAPEIEAETGRKR